MGLRLEQVVPWGRSLDEYIRMFDLTEAELTLNILDCAGGPASFNTELTQQGGNVLSCDPIYQFPADQIAQRIEATYAIVLQGVEANRHHFVWSLFESPDHLCQVRMAAMRQFLADFPQGLQQGRYRQEALPALPFQSGQFDLALCSHLLFTYSDQLSLDFHLSAIVEMCRVATEARIFPVRVNMTGEISPFLEPVMQTLTAQGYTVQLKTVDYEFQRGGNQLLQVSQNQPLR